jgi:hypothetical protein
LKYQRRIWVLEDLNLLTDIFPNNDNKIQLMFVLLKKQQKRGEKDKDKLITLMCLF